MGKLSREQIADIKSYLDEGKLLPPDYRYLLFPPEKKEYELTYDGKERVEDILQETLSVPLQPVKTFNHPKDAKLPAWANRLIFGDNLQAMKRLTEDPDIKGQVKLVYIDPPFASKQDFQGSQDQKAYQDKIAGAQFLEFLRKRLVFIRELLHPEGSLFVHLDWKKGHYVKILLDELFRENRFRNEIIWWYYNKMQGNVNRFPSNHETIFFYSAGETFTFNALAEEREGGKTKLLKRVWDSKNGRLVNAKDRNGKVIYIETDEKRVDDVWRLSMLQPADQTENIGYPTQKPETLLSLIISAASNPGDLVMDCFAGSGTTLAVAEKLGRRWVGMDCGKLAIYTIQKRMLNLHQAIGNDGAPIKAKPFTLYNAGLYDLHRVRDLPWEDYRTFALQLFQIRSEPHKLGGIQLDGYKGSSDALIFNFKENEGVQLDEEYIEELHKHLGSRARTEFFIIAPAASITFLEDYKEYGKTRYYILRIPYSIIDELHDRPFTEIRQPVDETEVNSIVDAVGFDFIQTPIVKSVYGVAKQKGGLFKYATISIHKFESRVYARKPREFKNRETLSMVMVDLDYRGNGEGIFELDAVFYRDQIEKDKWQIRLDPDSIGAEIAVIYIDIFGNEFREVKKRTDFGLKSLAPAKAKA